MLLDSNFRPGAVAWTTLILAVACGIAFPLLGGHPLDGEGSVGGPASATALIMAVLTIGAAIAAGVRDYARSRIPSD